MKTLILVILLCFSTELFAQWRDDFSDGNLSEWKGDTTDFIINAQNQLQLKALTGSEKFIYREFTNKPNLEWCLYFKLQFAPSTSNQLRIILSMDQPDVHNFEGYYLEIGENGNNDNWKLYALRQSKSIILGQGEFGKLAQDPAIARLKITRPGDTSWNIRADYTGSTIYSENISISDSIKIAINNSFFGLQCNYTSTRSDKFFFDDIIVDEPLMDLESPEIIDIQVIDTQNIQITFNEKTDLTSATILENYEIRPIGHPIQIKSVQENQFELRFIQSFKNDFEYDLIYNNIADQKGNQQKLPDSLKFKTSFSYYPVYSDIIITEIMFDPEPSVGMPNAEFVEIYNRSSNRLNLEGISIADENSASGKIGLINILPGQYIILCANKDTNSFKSFGNVIGLSSMPSLNNDQDQITIQDKVGNELDVVNYESSWHTDKIKIDGGYSIELYELNNNCKAKSAWGSTQNPLGGSPGQMNSKVILEKDLTPPRILEATTISEYEISLIFDEVLDRNSINNLSNYSISGQTSIASVDLVEQQKNEIILLLNAPLIKGQAYMITINQIKDCSGNASDQIKVEVVWPDEAGTGEILINEILFNPVSGGEDYIELFNQSNKTLSTQNLYLNNSDKDNLWTKLNSKAIIKAQAYLAFTPNSALTKLQYPDHDSLQIIESDLPTLDDDEGYLRLAGLVNGQLKIIDSIHYNQNWHNPLISDRSGVSLEKINPNLPSNIKRNWSSASKQSNYGTPGKQNSQFVNDTSSPSSSEPFTIESIVISPNGDNFRDYLIIHLNLDKAGYKSDIKIFDLSGKEIVTITESALGTNDILTWNGLDSNGNKIRSGNYILYIGFVHPQGDKMSYKRRIVMESK